MALFIAKAHDKNITAVVRARCLSCARDVLAEQAGAEGPLVWRDRTRSTVELLDGDGKRGVIMVSEGK